VVLLKEVLGRFGLEEDRLWLRWIGASEGNLFAETIRDMTEKIRALGPTEIRRENIA
jgi:coenzyme F420-reducing hydrogenase delta subunit